MKKIIFFTLAYFAFSMAGQAQTATNFISQDCQGKTHELFAGLDVGKVIVICWVMPCAPCVNPTLTTYKVVESYQAANPGKVLFYLADDNGNTACTDLSAWANKYKIYENAFSTRFSDPKIRMLDYESEGMPKVMVVAGRTHQVFYNENDEVNATELQNAINSALQVTSIKQNKALHPEICIFPNPASELLNISINAKKATKLNVQITDALGRESFSLFTEYIVPGENKITKNISAYKPGLYMLRISDDEAQRYFSGVIIIK